MKCVELVRYLQSFEPNDTVGVVVLDLNNRLRYSVEKTVLIDEIVTLFFEIADPKPLDEVEEEES